MMPPLNALRAFDAAAQHGSYSKAADELHVTHAAISHQIRKLEDWFGTQLFQREGRSIRLTKAGKELRDRTHGVFEELADIGQRFRTHHRKGSLVVGCIPSIATRWLVPNLREFATVCADVELQVLYAGMNDQLAESSHDLLISFNDQSSREIVEIPLLSRASYAVCSREYLERCGPFAEPGDLLSADLLHDESRDGWREWFQTAGIKHSQTLRGTICQDFNLLVVSAIAGHGLALCPTDVFRVEMDRGDLIKVFDIGINVGKYYRLFTRRSPSKAAAAFSTWFQSVCRRRSDD